MRAWCYRDVKNHVVKEYSMTWENVDDTFLSEKSCFQNSMIQNMKKRYLLLFTRVYIGRQIWLLYWLCLTRYPLSSSPCLAGEPILIPPAPPQFGVVILMPLGWIAYFNKDKQDACWSSMPKMSLFPLRAFWEQFLDEAGFLGSVD